jgi:hypothetical protein
MPGQTVAPARPIAPPRAVTAAPKRTSPYKIINDPTTRPYVTQPNARRSSTNAEATDSPSRTAPVESVLRRASAEQEVAEPAPLQIDYSVAVPIVRSQSPDDAAAYAVPHNPLRN